MSQPSGGLNKGELIGILIAATALGGLLIFGAVSGQDLPFWPSVLVICVNLVAAGKIVWRVQSGKKRAAQLRAQAAQAGTSAAPQDRAKKPGQGPNQGGKNKGGNARRP